jgi:thioredoxin 1
MTDEELERLRQKRLEALRNTPSQGKAPVEHLTDATFPAFIKENAAAMVDFWAPWCGPCRTMEPVIAEVATRWAGRVAVGKLNTDENAVAPAAFGIMSIPTLVFFKDGVRVERLTGARPRRDLEDVLSRMTSPPPPRHQTRL